MFAKRFFFLVGMAVTMSGSRAGTTPVLVDGCADGPEIGAFTLPLTTEPFALTDADFDLNGTGCSGTANINDAVLCFSPQNSCTLTIACDWTPAARRGAGQYLNLFAGSCTQTPTSCLAWDFDASNTELTDVAVTAGERYCVVCQDLEPGRVLTASLTATDGDCGLIGTWLFDDDFESESTDAWSLEFPCSPTPEICGDGIDQNCDLVDPACPANDLPAGAIDISSGGTFSVDLSAARDDHFHSGPACGSAGGRDVYYTFTLPADEVVYVDTFGSNFDTDLRIFDGDCTALGELQSCFDDQCSGSQSQGVLSLSAGTYCLVADQYSSAQTNGALVLSFVRGGRTGAALTGSISGNSCSGANVTTAGCQTNSTAQDVAYYFTACPAQNRTLAASTCKDTSFDSVLYLRKAPSTADIACNDDSPGCGGPLGRQSSFSGANAFGPGLFWLTVDGYQAECGPFTLTYSLN